MFNKVNPSREFFQEFCENPQKTFKKYGIPFDKNDKFLAQDFSKFSFHEFKERLEKSRFFEFFIF